MGWLKEAFDAKQRFNERVDRTHRKTLRQFAELEEKRESRIENLEAGAREKLKEWEKLGYDRIVEDIRKGFYPDSEISTPELLIADIIYRPDVDRIGVKKGDATHYISAKGNLVERMRSVDGVDLDEWAEGVEEDNLGVSFSIYHVYEDSHLVIHDGVTETATSHRKATDFKMTLRGDKVKVRGTMVPETEFDEAPDSHTMKRFLSASIRNYFDSK